MATLPDANALGMAPSTPLPTALSGVLPTMRARSTLGLRTRPLATGTIQVTTAGVADTFDPKVNSVSLVSAPVVRDTDVNTTAAAIATAINANFANHNYLATVATDTVTVRQRRSGAITGALATTVTGTGATTTTDFSIDTDTWTEFVSGATFDGNLYYELGWSGSLLAVSGLSAALARAIDLDFYCDGQAVTFWVGSFRAASNLIVQGLPLATATWLHTTYGQPWPFLKTATVDLNTDIPFIIKVASDEELLYSVGVI